MKDRRGWRDYDYEKMYTPGGEDHCEIVLTPAADVRIFAEG
jgi:hypothetical protein